MKSSFDDERCYSSKVSIRMWLYFGDFHPKFDTDFLHGETRESGNSDKCFTSGSEIDIEHLLPFVAWPTPSPLKGVLV